MKIPDVKSTILNSEKIAMMHNSTLIFLFTILFFTNCLAQEGNLDFDFGNEGISTVHFDSSEDSARAVAIQSDGKIVIAGNSGLRIALTRLNSDGTIDTSFGDSGKVITSLGSDSMGFAVKVQNDGKIIIAGYSNLLNYSFTLVRYLSDGTIDTSFGNNGIVLQLPNNYTQIFRTLAIQDDGKILAAGDGYFGNDRKFVIMRFHEDGTLDTTFGNGGIFHILIGEIFNQCSAIAIQANGKIVLVGTTGIFIKEIAVLRLNPNGTLDTTFGEEGELIISISGDSDSARDVDIQSDGKIIVSGGASNPGEGRNFLAIRLNIDGTFDNTFGTNGIAVNNTPDTTGASTCIIQPNGDIVLIGTSYNQTIDEHNVTLMKFKETGTIDTLFGANGIVEIHGEGSRTYLADTAIEQQDGNIVICGTEFDIGGRDFLAMRVLMDLELGVLETDKNTALLFYPNPIQEVSVLKFELVLTQEVSIVLTDVTGKKVKTFMDHKMTPAGRVEEFLDFTNITSGTYILTIKTKESSSSIKVNVSK